MQEPRFVSVAGEPDGGAPASDVVVAGGLAFVSGVRAVDLFDARVPLPENVEVQTERIFRNLDLILESAGLAPRQLLGVCVYLVDFERLFERMNTAYVECLGQAPSPARTCIGVNRLTRGALVEMDFTVRAPF